MAIAPFAELERSPEHVHMYRLTPLGLWNARAAGHDAESVVDALLRFSKYPVPHSLLVDVAETMDRYGRLQLVKHPTHGLALRGLDKAVLVEVAKNKKLAYEFINFQLDPAIQRAWCLAYFCSPGRGDITDWPKQFAETQIVTAKQFDSVKLPDPDAIGANRKDWTLKWQEIMG